MRVYIYIYIYIYMDLLTYDCSSGGVEIMQWRTFSGIGTDGTVVELGDMTRFMAIIACSCLYRVTALQVGPLKISSWMILGIADFVSCVTKDAGSVSFLTRKGLACARTSVTWSSVKDDEITSTLLFILLAISACIDLFDFARFITFFFYGN